VCFEKQKKSSKNGRVQDVVTERVKRAQWKLKLTLILNEVDP
jgi:hypothetical protein